MNIDEALRRVEGFLGCMERMYCSEDIGEEALMVEDELWFLVNYAKTMRATPTTHDSKAESDSWDEFFEERKRLANENRIRI